MHQFFVERKAIIDEKVEIGDEKLERLVKNRRAVMKTWIALLLVLASSVVQAQSAFPIQKPQVPLTPEQGAWVLEGLPNNGVTVHVDESGFAFVAWFTHDANRRGSWLVMQGQLSRTEEPERRASGVMARLRSTLFEGNNGTCPTCTPQPATVTPSSLGEGEIVWRDTRRATLTYGGRSVAMSSFVTNT